MPDTFDRKSETLWNAEEVKRTAEELLLGRGVGKDTYNERAVKLCFPSVPVVSLIC